jgi:hypothetical protein
MQVIILKYIDEKKLANILAYYVLGLHDLLFHAFGLQRGQNADKNPAGSICSILV